MFDSLGQHFWRANQKIERERCRERQPNSHGLTNGIPSRHHHEKINIAIGVWRAICVGTKQDDSLWLKLLGDLPCEITNLPSSHGDH